MSIKLSTFSCCFFLGSRIVLKVISQATTAYFYHISLIFNLTLSNFLNQYIDTYQILNREFQQEFTTDLPKIYQPFTNDLPKIYQK